jgi:glutaconyl-CoA decarboxylase
MKPYFEKMKEFGQELKPGQIKSTEASVKQIQEVEAQVAEAVEKVKNAGLPTEKINARGQLTVWQRLEYLVDPGTWNPTTRFMPGPGSPASLKTYSVAPTLPNA